MDIKDLAGFSEPAKILIERVCDGVGAIFRPNQIIRVAKADSKADLIKARGQVEVDKIRILGGIKVSEVEKRALARLAYEEGKYQQNMEDILKNALPDVKEDAKPEAVEGDWFINFFDKCRLISDPEMQTLWGKVLAGEANEPGSFSKRTVNFIQTLSKNEAEKFQLLCCFSIASENFTPLIYDPKDEFFVKNGLNIMDMQILNDIGLIILEGLVTYSVPINVPKFELFYFDTTFEIRIPEKDDFKIGQVVMTELGREIAKLCSIRPIHGFSNYLVGKWSEFGYTITQLPESSDNK